MGSDILYFLKMIGMELVYPIVGIFIVEVVLAVFFPVLGGLKLLDRALGVEIDPVCDTMYTRRTRFFTYGFKYLYGELDIPTFSFLNLVMAIIAVTNLLAFIGMGSAMFYLYIGWFVKTVQSFPQHIVNTICAWIIFYAQLVLMLLVAFLASVMSRENGRRMLVRNFSQTEFFCSSRYDSEYNLIGKYFRNNSIAQQVLARKDEYLAGTFKPDDILADLIMKYFIIQRMFFFPFFIFYALFFGINYMLLFIL